MNTVDNCIVLAQMLQRELTTLKENQKKGSLGLEQIARAVAQIEISLDASVVCGEAALSKLGEQVEQLKIAQQFLKQIKDDANGIATDKKPLEQSR